jgi:hypothetical protein
MAGLEVVVRPVVFPNIRPPAARALAPDDNPNSGIAVINGSGGKLLDLPRSWSVSTTKSTPYKETKRQFNKERVYQKDENGINKSNFVDVERLKKVQMEREEGDPIRQSYASPPKIDNVETLETDAERTTDPTADDGGGS